MNSKVISLIAALDRSNGIGKQGNLLCHLPADLRHFKSITLGKPVVMGHATYKSIGKPLPSRKNIVFSRSYRSSQSVTFVQDVKEALEASDQAEEIMVIGGGTIYELFLPLADRLILTHIHANFEADVYFPEIDAKRWFIYETREYIADESNLYNFTIKTYHRR